MKVIKTVNIVFILFQKLVIMMKTKFDYIEHSAHDYNPLKRDNGIERQPIIDKIDM